MTQRENPVKLHLKIKELEAEIERLKQPRKGLCMTDRQLQAVTEAIADTGLHGMPLEDCEATAKAAIEASGAKYVPMLAEALKEIGSYCHHVIVEDTPYRPRCADPDWIKRAVEQALAQLPKEYRQ